MLCQAASESGATTEPASVGVTVTVPTSCARGLARSRAPPRRMSGGGGWRRQRAVGRAGMHLQSAASPKLGRRRLLSMVDHESKAGGCQWHDRSNLKRPARRHSKLNSARDAKTWSGFVLK